VNLDEYIHAGRKYQVSLPEPDPALEPESEFVDVLYMRAAKHMGVGWNVICDAFGATEKERAESWDTFAAWFAEKYPLPLTRREAIAAQKEKR